MSNETVDRAAVILIVVAIVGYFAYQALQPFDTTQPATPPAYQHPEEYQP